MMNMGIFVCVLIGCLVASAQGFDQSGYIVTSPSVFRSNVDHVISVRVFNYARDVRVIAKLLDLRDNLIVSVRGDINTAGNLTIKVPAGVWGGASLTVCGNCHLSDGFHFFNRTTVTIVNTGSFALLQPDKPIYKPGQRVYLNVFLLDRDLLPVNENAANDARIMQWKNMKPACCGVINVSFPISDQPILGMWTLYASINQNLYNTTIEVRKYVLPKFEVKILPPPFFRGRCEDVTVEAAYVFGKPIVGRVKVNISVEGAGYFKTQFLDRGTPIYKNLELNRSISFPVCLNQLLPDDLPGHFLGHLHIHATVTSETGEELSAFDDSTPVTRVKAEIEFTDDTRKHFKAGIPFTGKIRSTHPDGSPAPNVAARLIVMANHQEFIRQDLVSDNNGVMSFTVPEVQDEIRFLILEASILSVNGAAVGSHGGSIRRYLYNWHSPSGCFILADASPAELQVGEGANLTIKSSCPCNFTLYYEILSRGNIVQTGSQLVTPRVNQHRSRRRRSFRLAKEFPLEVTSSENDAPRHVCDATIHINVTASMAPTSRILVYYVRENGEGVADSIIVPVRPRLQNEVRVVTSPTQVSPGSTIEVEVTSSPGSCVCLAMVDRSVHVMKPGYRINQKHIFEHLRDFDLDNSPPQDHWSAALRAKRSGGWLRDQTPKSHDAKHAFLESGLVVMTNTVSLNYRSTQEIFDRMTLQAMTYNARTSDEQPEVDKNHVTTKRRTYFPETWIWSCFNMSTSGRNTFSMQVPDSVTTWRADAVAMDPQIGVGISTPTTLRTIKDFFVDFTLPYSAIRGEVVQIPVTAFNYLDLCLEAVLQITVPPGVAFLNLTERTLSMSMCVTSQSTKTSHVALRFDNLGHKNLTASLKGFQSSVCCGGSSSSGGSVAADEVSRKILVQAEGIKRRYSHSVYFCPNERINISTSDSRSLQFVRLPANQSQGFDFLVKAPGNVRVTLAEEESVSDQSYEIVIGGENNRNCWISRGSMKILQASCDQYLSTAAFKPFWISWADGSIQVGTGSSPSVQSQFMYAGEISHASGGINYIGFATTDGANGEFRLWQKEIDEKYSQQFISLSLPPNHVPHSERATASIIGDVMGPTLKNLNNLLSLPFGCGEQNLANFAPNVYVLKYLKGTRQINEETRLKAIRYLQMGYQRQLTYKHMDGSYSAFGARDFNGSMWLTAFVLKSFSQAEEFIYIHPKDLQDAMDWIISWQRKDGAFPPVGKIWNKDIQTGVDSDVALTAYVTIALLEANCQDEMVLLKAKEYLESAVRGRTDPYTASLTAYTLTMLNSDIAAEARDQLYELATHDASTTHWGLRESEAVSDVMAAELMFSIGDSLKQTVISAEVETTAFALLTFTKTKNQTVALPIVRWLSKKRNAMGGFSSTQDTCVALQALSEYAIFSFIGGVNLRVVVDCSNDCSNEFLLNNDNDKVLQSMPVQVPTVMFVNAFGVGCALLQVDVSYNIPQFDDQPSFSIKASHREAPGTTASSGMNYEMEACVRWLGSGSSNMAVLEFNLLTGYDADLESLEQLLRQNTINLKRYEVEGQIVFFYFDEVYSTCETCVRFIAKKGFETATIQPRTVKVYDYYEPTYESEVLYPAKKQENDEAVFGGGIQEESEWPECRCRHDCGFSGPSVCGNNSVLYLNQCRMVAAACEENSQIEARQLDYCQESEAENNDEMNPLENMFELMMGGEDEVQQHFSEQNPLEEEIIHPFLVSNEPEPNDEFSNLFNS